MVCSRHPDAPACTLGVSKWERVLKDEDEANEDIFNNEAMENPTGDEEHFQSARFIMPAERRAPGPSVNNEESVQSKMPTENPVHRIENENEYENTNLDYEEYMDV